MTKKQFKTESKRILELMINSIYTNKDIFLREIISNASDAIDKLAFTALTDENVGLSRGDFKIVITPDRNARTLTVIPLTARLKKLSLVTHVMVKPTKACPLEYDSMALTEQITIIDKCMLREKIGRLDRSIMQKVDRALCVQLGLWMPDSPKGGGAA